METETEKAAVRVVKGWTVEMGEIEQASRRTSRDTSFGK